MKKILMLVPYFLLWIFYWFLTLDKRNEYIVAKSKNMYCNRSYDSSWFIPGCITTYELDPNRKPERNYITWKEFWQRRGY